MWFSVFSLLPAGEVITLPCGLISSFVRVYLLTRRYSRRFWISGAPAAGFWVGQRLGSADKCDATPFRRHSRSRKGADRMLNVPFCVNQVTLIWGERSTKTALLRFLSGFNHFLERRLGPASTIPVSLVPRKKKLAGQTHTHKKASHTRYL